MRKTSRIDPDICDCFDCNVKIGQLERFLRTENGFPDFQWSKSDVVSEIVPDKDVSVGSRALIVRREGRGFVGECLSWGWIGPRRRTIFNIDIEGRDFSLSERVLIVATGVHGYGVRDDGERKAGRIPVFGLKLHPWFWIPGVVKKRGFAMLTNEAGSDIRRYQDRQVCVLPPTLGPAWIDLSRPERELFTSTPAGMVSTRFGRARENKSFELQLAS